jgi:hypothetical protein
MTCNCWVRHAVTRDEQAALWERVHHMQRIGDANGLYIATLQLAGDCPARPGAAIDAFSDARSLVLDGLGLADSERDTDLADFIETAFRDRLAGRTRSLDDIIRDAGDDPAEVRTWWSGWA